MNDRLMKAITTRTVVLYLLRIHCPNKSLNIGYHNLIDSGSFEPQFYAMLCLIITLFLKKNFKISSLCNSVFNLLSDTAVAVVRKLFTDNKGGNHRKDNDQDISSPRVSKEVCYC